MANRIFVDMDGVLADFDRLKLEMECTGDDLKCRPGAFRHMHPITGALAGVRSLIGMGFEVWIATKPPTGIPHAYADKADWILRHLPELKRRIIMTHNKGLLGDCDDYLIDDRPHKAFCSDFKGYLFQFHINSGWESVLTFFRGRRAGLETPAVQECTRCHCMERTQRVLGDPRQSFGGIPFTHWSKDPLIPYKDCYCSSCNEARNFVANTTDHTG